MSTQHAELFPFDTGQTRTPRPDGEKPAAHHDQSFITICENDDPIDPLTQSALIQGHAERALDLLPEETIQTVVTSPPYWSLRDYNIDEQIGRDELLEDYISGLVSTFRKVQLQGVTPKAGQTFARGDPICSSDGGFTVHATGRHLNESPRLRDAIWSGKLTPCAVVRYKSEEGTVTGTVYGYSGRKTMSQASFDTHAAIRKLEKAGCPVPQAEAFVSVVMQAADPHLQLAKEVQQLRLHVETSIASKTDLADLRTEMQQLRLHVETNMASKTDLADLRAEMQDRFSSVDERFSSVDERFASIDERFASIDERIAGMAAAIASLAERQQSTKELMVTKGEFFRAIWVQGGVLAALILTLAASMVSFVAFTLNGS